MHEDEFVHGPVQRSVESGSVEGYLKFWDQFGFEIFDAGESEMRFERAIFRRFTDVFCGGG